MVIMAATLTSPHHLFSPSSILTPSISNPRKLFSLSSSPKPRINRAVQRFRNTGFSVELQPSLVVKNKASDVSNELKGTSIFLVGCEGNCLPDCFSFILSIYTTTKVCLLQCKDASSLCPQVTCLILCLLSIYFVLSNDSLVAQAAGGESAAKSFKEIDEKGFRDSETEVLKQLSCLGRRVVCAGDDAVQNSSNLALLRYGISIWIDVPLDTLANEILESEFPASVTEDTRHSDPFTEVNLLTLICTL